MSEVKVFELKCPYCKSPATLQNSKIIYGQDYGLMYICTKYPDCETYVGCNKKTGKPSGTLANKELRELRKKARNDFQALYMNKVLKTRERGFSAKKTNAEKLMLSMLADELGVPENRCKINWFDVDMCNKVINFCNKMKSKQG